MAETVKDSRILKVEMPSTLFAPDMPVSSNREGMILRLSRTIRDNEPSGSHPCLMQKKATMQAASFAERQDSFSALLRKRKAITNPRVLIPL